MDTQVMNTSMTTAHTSLPHSGSMPHPVSTPHADDPVKMKEHMALMSLVPDTQATHVAVRDGSWFDPSIWQNGQVPGNGAHVLIGGGVTVSYDGESEARLKTMRLDGTLTFATDRNTKMVVDTFVEMPTGTLNIGTADNPVQAGNQAQIIIANEGAIDTNWDPSQLSRGLITHGQVNIYGAEKTDFIALAQDAIAGDSELILKAPPAGWQIGDKLVLGGTSYGWKGSDQDNSRFQDEVLTITAIDGNRVRFTNEAIASGDNTVLRYDHTRPDIPEKDQLNLYVANTSRNVTIESEDGRDTPIGQRGHVMFMHNPNVNVHNAGFYHLGRSDKTRPVDDVGQNVDGSDGNGSNQRGRYGLHLHRTGAEDPNGQAAIVTGNAVVDTPGWGIVHHDSHAIIKDNVVFDVAGSGIVAEAGNELGLWENNITIKTTGIPWEKISQQRAERDRKFDMGFRGEGYWVQGAAQVAMKNNVAVSASDTGITLFGDTNINSDFRPKETFPVNNLPLSIRDKVATPGQEEVHINDVPLRQLTGFESYNTGTGMQVWGQMTNFDGHLEFSSPGSPTAHQVRGLIDNFKLWNNRANGLRVLYSSNLDFENGLMVGNVENPNRGTGLFHNHGTFQTHYKNLTVKGFKEGLEVEFLNEERDFTRSSIENSRFSDNLYHLQAIGLIPAHKGQPDDFPAEFAMKNTSFEEQENNRAPIANFNQRAVGGLAVAFDAGASYDRDPLKPENLSPQYPIESKGIAAYAWDFDNDGQVDSFGRKVTHLFQQAGPHNVTLQVFDNQGATQTLTQTIEVQPTAFSNAFKNGRFNSSSPFLAAAQDNSQWSNGGWFATNEVRKINGAAVLSQAGTWTNTIGQVVENSAVHQGNQTLSFRLKNLEGGDQPWQSNEVTLELWGVNGQFDQDYWQETGPVAVGTLPMARTLLYTQTFGGKEGEFFDWRNFTSEVDLGTGYQFLLFQAKAKNVADQGDDVAIDNVDLSGAATPTTPPIVPVVLSDESPSTAATVVTTLADIVNAADNLVSLREAIAAATAGDTITFAPDLAGQNLTLTAGLDVTTDLTIEGNNVTLIGDDFDLINSIKANLTLQNLNFSGGSDAIDFRGHDKALNLTNVSIDRSADDGIDLEAAKRSNVTLDNVDITRVGDEGVEVRNSNRLQLNVLNGSSIVNSGKDGIDVEGRRVSLLIAGGSNIADSGGKNINLDDVIRPLITLSGTDAADVLVGSSAADIIIGGLGNDTTTGGAGADVFKFGVNSGQDLITDFTLGEDRLDVTALGITNLNQVTLSGDEVDFNGANGEKVSLTGITAAALTASNFVFA